MSAIPLLGFSDCTVILVDEQAGFAYATGSADGQILRSNAVALARTSIAFNVPFGVKTSASRV